MVSLLYTMMGVRQEREVIDLVKKMDYLLSGMIMVRKNRKEVLIIVPKQVHGPTGKIMDINIYRNRIQMVRKTVSLPSGMRMVRKV